jgi:hypothetical protein
MSDYCPYCQSLLHGDPPSCPLHGPMGRSLKAVGNTRKPDMDTSAKLRCPYCQADLSGTTVRDVCPICRSELDHSITHTKKQRGDPLVPREDMIVQSVPLNSRRAVQTSGQPGSVLGARYGEGTIFGEPVKLADEPRNRDPIQILSVIVLAAEVILFALYISAQLLIVAVLFIVLALLLGGLVPTLGTSCLSVLFQIPLRLVQIVVSPLREAIDPGRNPANMRHVHEYRLDLDAGDVDAFVVKGNLAPRTLRAGDHVRVRVDFRNDRPYFASGECRNPATGSWDLLRISEPPVGLYWLLGVGVLNIVLFFIYVNYLQPR